MRRLVVSMFCSLDGYVAAPNDGMDWVISGFDAKRMGADMGRLQASAGDFLLGRRTYQIMANVWPNLTEEQSSGADVMNRTPKIVASRTLSEVPWGTYGNARLVGGDIVEELRRL